MTLINQHLSCVVLAATRPESDQLPDLLLRVLPESLPALQTLYPSASCTHTWSDPHRLQEMRSVSSDLGGWRSPQTVCVSPGSRFAKRAAPAVSINSHDASGGARRPDPACWRNRGTADPDESRAQVPEFRL